MTRKGVLLIHGLTGSPHELLPIEQSLLAAGYATHRTSLPGHGDSPTVGFHETSAIEILDHCASEYEAFAKDLDEVFIIGHSLGGICTLLTASVQPPKLKGIITFAAPFENAFFFNYPHGLVRMPVHHLVQGLNYAPRHKIKCRRPAVPPWHLPRLLAQTKIMFNLMREQVQNIEVPVCLAHSLYDLTIPYTEMEKLAKRIGKPDLVSINTLRNSGHRIFPMSPDVDEAMKLIFQFLDEDCHRMANGQCAPESASA